MPRNVLRPTQLDRVGGGGVKGGGAGGRTPKQISGAKRAGETTKFRNMATKDNPNLSGVNNMLKARARHERQMKTEGLAEMNKR